MEIMAIVSKIHFLYVSLLTLCLLIKNFIQFFGNGELCLCDVAQITNHQKVLHRITKHFIDCGGKEQTLQLVNFQLWAAEDVNHRLTPQKLSEIIKQTQRILNIPDDLEIEIEYQSDTIGKYGLAFEAGVFVLTKKKTTCLARDRSTPLSKKNALKCTPENNCC